MKAILGRKVGMTQVFATDGTILPVTVIEVLPNVVMQKKTLEKDGYEAVQLGIEDKKEKNATKAELGHAAKAKHMAISIPFLMVTLKTGKSSRCLMV